MTGRRLRYNLPLFTAKPGERLGGGGVDLSSPVAGPSVSSQTEFLVICEVMIYYTWVLTILTPTWVYNVKVLGREPEFVFAHVDDRLLNPAL